MRTIRFSSLSTQLGWTVDRDSVLTGVLVPTLSTGVLVASDGALTISELTTPSLQVVKDELVVYVFHGTTASGVAFVGDLKIPLQGDSQIFVNFSGVGSAILFLDEPEPS